MLYCNVTLLIRVFLYNHRRIAGYRPPDILRNIAVVLSLQQTGVYMNPRAARVYRHRSTAFDTYAETRRRSLRATSSKFKIIHYSIIQAKIAMPVGLLYQAAK